MDTNQLEEACKTSVGSADCGCGAPAVLRVCKRPFYDAFDTCLICSHDRTCHVDQQETPDDSVVI